MLLIFAFRFCLFSSLDAKCSILRVSDYSYYRNKNESIQQEKTWCCSICFFRSEVWSVHANTFASLSLLSRIIPRFKGLFAFERDKLRVEQPVSMNYLLRYGYFTIYHIYIFNYLTIILTMGGPFLEVSTST